MPRLRSGTVFVVLLVLAACSTRAEPSPAPTPEEHLIPTLAQATEIGQDATPSNPAAADSCSLEASVDGEDDRWRFGVGMAEPVEIGRWATELGFAWYLDWTARAPSDSERAIRWQMVRVSEDGILPSLEQVRKLAGDYPGGSWIIGNEPDVIWQDNLTPERYAERYHDLFQAINSADPTAQVGVGAVAMVSPLRLAYLDRVLDVYRDSYGVDLPSDFWTVHAYVLREERGSWGVEIPPGFSEDQGLLWEVADHDRLDLFEAQLRNFRAWMASHGYRNQPLYLTEFGLLMSQEHGFSLERVRAYMVRTLDLLRRMRDAQTGYALDDDRLIQAWAWFSLAYSVYSNSDLVDLEQDQLTPLGEVYRACIEAADRE